MGFGGGRGGSNARFMMSQRKPLAERNASATQIVNRLRGKFQGVPGARLTLVPQQDIFVGGRQSSGGSYDYSLLGSELALLKEWLPKVQRAMAGLTELVDVDTDVADKGRRVELVKIGNAHVRPPV